MSYVATDSQGMGFIVEAAAAVVSIVTGAIDLSTQKEAIREQRRLLAQGREDAWAAELGDIEHARYLRAQDAQVLAAQNTVTEERSALLEEQERVVGHERAALQAQIRRNQLIAARRAREQAAQTFKMPTWAWVALAGIGIAAGIGTGAFVALSKKD